MFSAVYGFVQSYLVPPTPPEVSPEARKAALQLVIAALAPQESPHFQKQKTTLRALIVKKREGTLRCALRQLHTVQKQQTALEALASKKREETLCRPALGQLRTALKQRTALRTLVAKKRKDTLRQALDQLKAARHSPYTFQEQVKRESPENEDLLLDAAILDRNHQDIKNRGLVGLLKQVEEPQTVIFARQLAFQKAVAYLDGEADEIINRCFSECRDGYRPFNEKELFNLFIEQRTSTDIELKLQKLEQQNIKFRTERIHLQVSRQLDELKKLNETFCGYIQKYLGHEDFKTGQETFTRLLSVLKPSLEVGDLAKAEQEQLQREAISVLGQMEERVKAVVPFLIQLCESTPQAGKELEQLSGNDRTDHENAWIQPAQYPTRVVLLGEALLKQTASTEIKDIVDRLKVVLSAFNQAIPQLK